MGKFNKTGKREMPALNTSSCNNNARGNIKGTVYTSGRY